MKKIVIDLELNWVDLMTDAEIRELEKREGPGRWEEYGPYECSTIREALDALSNWLGSELYDGKPRLDELSKFKDVLDELARLDLTEVKKC